ncbi:NlpC/P60 family protein [Aureimonas jatrophae]|uniref:Putative phage cell wall peptidase, NlpC/P60 family n=1 Tax=Aureimonas jatrophae TaxID=1166073 RepID=A0A1H0CQE3_9HYPH|nr:NlpC/P60 family protein [Aureimonas jatrophae]MBB3949338.1 NlpC/P60 family putative phage cell wall peptidase [Aureimonas jatrophae]SDN60109.1 putative phage cell wall peptidase, NlpC/P60 family [Aureimonas jatrophae]
MTGARRNEALREARRFLGTPYRHQGSRAGVGCDCLGLVRGVWRALYGAEPEAMPTYAADWAELATGDPLLEAARRHFPAVDRRDARPGDLVLFRWRDGRPARHCAILDEPDAAGPRILHALEGAAVISSPLAGAWARRICGQFQFP